MDPVDSPAHATARSTDWRTRPDVWRGRRSDAALPAVASGYQELDRWLPAHGWPLGSLCEILREADGNGELSLLLPALTRMASTQRPVVWIVPPYQPHAPALRQRDIPLDALRVVRSDPGQALWAAEQCLRAGCCAAVLVWPGQTTTNALRRLQLAAETGRCHGFLFRDIRHLAQPSPAPLRLSVRREAGRVQVRFDKCRGLLTPPSGFIDVTAATSSDDLPSSNDGPVCRAAGPVPAIRSTRPTSFTPVRSLPRTASISRIDAAHEGPAADGQPVSPVLLDVLSAAPATPSHICAASRPNSGIAVIRDDGKPRSAAALAADLT